MKFTTNGEITVNCTVNGIEQKLTFDAGTHKITGLITEISFSWCFNLISVDEWGDFKPFTCYEMFYECVNLETLPIEVPDLSDVTDMYCMFSNCKKFNSDINNWNVDKKNRMDNMFYNCHNLLKIPDWYKSLI